MVTNAAAALAVAGVVGVDLDAALDALATARLSAMRMEVFVAPSGATIVNDAYNANPTSMYAALDALAAMDGDRRVAVLGLMGEIDDAPTAHRDVAAHARDLGLELLVVGKPHRRERSRSDAATHRVATETGGGRHPGIIVQV